MRALSYFTFDPDARAGRFSREELTDAFASYCEEGKHRAQGTFLDAKGSGGGSGWRTMVDFIRGNRLGYLVVVPSAEHLGATIEQQVAGVLELDGLACQVVCDDPDFPDPLQNALRRSDQAAARRERIKEGMKAKAVLGLGLGKPPYGYRINVEGAFIPVPKEAEVVASIFHEYLQPGGSVRSVAAALNSRGLRTRNGHRWSIVGIRDILRNTAYIGTYRRFGLHIPSSYEPTVSAQEFRQAQDRMRERSPDRRNRKSAFFLLSGIVYCGYCGQRMMGVVRRQAWRRKDGARAHAEYRYYQCQTRINRNQCGYRTIRADALEEQAVTEAHERMAAGERGTEGWDDSHLAEDRADALESLHALDRQFLQGIERAAKGTMPLGQLRRGYEQLCVLKEGLNSRIEQTTDSASIALLHEERVQKFLCEWKETATEQQRDLLRSVVSRVTVKRGQGEVTLR